MKNRQAQQTENSSHGTEISCADGSEEDACDIRDEIQEDKKRI